MEEALYSLNDPPQIQRRILDAAPAKRIDYGVESTLKFEEPFRLALMFSPDMVVPARAFL